MAKRKTHKPVRMSAFYPLSSRRMLRLCLVFALACSGNTDPEPQPTTPEIEAPAPDPELVELPELEGGPRVQMGVVTIPAGKAIHLAGSRDQEVFVHIRRGALMPYPTQSVLRIRQPVTFQAEEESEILLAMVRDESTPFPDDVDAEATSTGRRVRVVNRETHDTLPFAGGKLRVKIFYEQEDDGRAHGAFSLLDGDADLSVPEHVHEQSAEVLFIESGDGTMILGEERFALEPGKVVYVPPNTNHGYEAGTQPLRALQVYAPPGPEQRFRTPPQVTP